MSEIKLKRISWLRRRFMRSEVLSSLNSWSDIFEDLKKEILSQTAFQLVGKKGVVEVDSESGDSFVLVEVVGIPRATCSTEDHEACEVLVFDRIESVFEVDFLTIKLEAKKIMGGIAQRLGPKYHIVFDGNHLALHFFI